MTRMIWSEPDKRFFETGLDRGVLYLQPDNPESSPRGYPWNGLTSVDENGAESATAYYIDGRPFLFLPKRKEYTATLTAYTYPDEFMKVMGTQEVTNADGIFLDSQTGLQFGLSYRTRVGNAINGIDHGYKIHLVYNASVSPQGRSYATLSSTVSPSEFSWDIQAVPTRIEGYHASAHITIDTRFIDQDKLEQIETILYGDEDNSPYMPGAQELIDLLSFGGMITITDNGDGTWSAEGSYHNIYMIGDEVFQIDNVDAIDLGDGVYRISTTFPP